MVTIYVAHYFISSLVDENRVNHKNFSLLRYSALADACNYSIGETEENSNSHMNKKSSRKKKQQGQSVLHSMNYRNEGGAGMEYRFYIGEERIPLSSLSKKEKEDYLRWLNDRALRGMGYVPAENESALPAEKPKINRRV